MLITTKSRTKCGNPAQADMLILGFVSGEPGHTRDELVDAENAGVVYSGD